MNERGREGNELIVKCNVRVLGNCECVQGRTLMRLHERSMKHGGSKTGFHWNYKVSSRSVSSQECVKDTPHGQAGPGVKVTRPSHVCPPDVASYG